MSEVTKIDACVNTFPPIACSIHQKEAELAQTWCKASTSRSRGASQSEAPHAAKEQSPEPADAAQSLPVILSQLRALERDQSQARDDLKRLQNLVTRAIQGKIASQDSTVRAMLEADQYQRQQDNNSNKSDRSDSPMSDDDVSMTTLDYPDLVASGLISPSQVPVLYYKCIATRIALLPSKSLLRNTALTLALRAAPRTESTFDQFERCVTRMRRALHSIHELPTPNSIEEHHDRVHAMTLLSVFMSDISLARKTISEAMAAGLHQSRANLLACLKQVGNDVTGSRREQQQQRTRSLKDETNSAMAQFELWLSVVTVDNFLTLYLDVPPLATMIDRHDAIELVHLMFKQGVATPWLVVAGAYSQMSSLINIGQNDLANYRRGPVPISSFNLSQLRTVLSLHDQWIERTTQSRDAERGSLPGLTIAAALGQLSLMRCCLEPVEPQAESIRNEFLKRAIGACEHLMQTALSSDLYRLSLKYTIEYVFYNSFNLVHKFVLFGFKHLSKIYNFSDSLHLLKTYHQQMRENVCLPSGQDMLNKLNLMSIELMNVMEQFEASSPRSVLSVPSAQAVLAANADAYHKHLQQQHHHHVVSGGSNTSSPSNHQQQPGSQTPSTSSVVGVNQLSQIPISQSSQQLVNNTSNNNIINNNHHAPTVEWSTGVFDFFGQANLDLVIDTDWLNLPLATINSDHIVNNLTPNNNGDLFEPSEVGRNVTNTVVRDSDERETMSRFNEGRDQVDSTSFGSRWV
ncbi:hypothetical protein OIO90_005843 [Microbotryomycetes sp. JL221]|nr:hypothetical protein OIO90_005843 [Microbotryomycetes sp. JL221]